jgi:hypothetical protein
VNAAAVAWALRQKVVNAPTKLLLIEMAARCQAHSQVVTLTRHVRGDLAAACSIRLYGIQDRLRELQQLNVLTVHGRGELLAVSLQTGRG